MLPLSLRLSLALTACGLIAACGGSADSAEAPASTATPTRAPAPAPAPTQSSDSLVLPIEVLGAGAPDSPTIVARQFSLGSTSLARVSKLMVRCHRCGFYNPPEFEGLSKPLTKITASFRLPGGSQAADAPWIDIADGTVQLRDADRAQGGINGGQLTLSFTVPLDATARARLVASPALNRIEFRFNGTDGSSNGFRILDLQVQDSAGADLVSTPRQWVDPSGEKTAGQAWTADADAGKKLWNQTGLLLKSPIVASRLRAACSSCHASDGRDLQYFNYSNNAIVQRSRFHGLTEAQGSQIAAYLRAELFGKVSHVAAASPWNPPYQPGPGMDSKPVVEWAAGAGLDAVLPDGKAFLKAWVGSAPTQADIDKAMDPSGLMNTREMPVALQFPDWNAWLADAHPLDVWTPDAGQSAGLFETGKGGANPFKAYTDLKAWLNARKNPNGVYGDWTHLSADQRIELQGLLNAFGNQTTSFAGGGRGFRISGATGTARNGVEIGAEKMAARLSASTAALADTTKCGPNGPCTAFSKESFIERADYQLFHWMAVKQWEIAHTYGLEEPPMRGRKDAAGKWVPEGEKRGWAYDWPSVFLLAPHMLYQTPENKADKRDNYFSWENRLISFYRTNQWYQLQMTVNPGWPGMVGPMDWPYHMGFTTALVDDLISTKAPASVAAMHVIRWQQIRAKLSQLANTDIPFNAPRDPSKPLAVDNNTGFNSKADLLFKIAPTPLMDLGPAPWQKTAYPPLFETVYPGLHMMFVNSSIAAYNTMYANTTLGQYRICDPNDAKAKALLGDRDGHGEEWAGQRFCADAKRTPLPVGIKGGENTDYPGLPYLPYDGKWTTEQYIAWGIMSATALNAEPVRLRQWSDWYQRMWPR